MQKEIQLTDKTLLVVGLEPNCTKVRHFETINELEIVYGDIIFGKEYEYIKLVGNYELLGIYPELTEEQAKMLVELHSITRVQQFGYKDYLKSTEKIDHFTCKTALESCQSLMEREKLFTSNPYGNYFADLAYGGDTHTPTFEQWQDAETKTFNKYAILIKLK